MFTAADATEFVAPAPVPPSAAAQAVPVLVVVGGRWKDAWSLVGVGQAAAIAVVVVVVEGKLAGPSLLPRLDG